MPKISCNYLRYVEFSYVLFVVFSLLKFSSKSCVFVLKYCQFSFFVMNKNNMRSTVWLASNPGAKKGANVAGNKFMQIMLSIYLDEN